MRLPTVAPIPGLDVSYPPLPSLAGLSPHGLFAAAGIAAGYLLLLSRGRRVSLPTAPLEHAAGWGIVAGIIGARVDYLISHPSQFISPLGAIKLWEGGLALFGGLIAGVSAAVLSLRRDRFPIATALDLAAPPIALAIAIGRIGDLLLLDHLGRPSDSSWTLTYQIPLGAQLAPGFGPNPAAYPALGQACTDLGAYYAGCHYYLTPAYDLLAAALLLWYLTVLSRRPHPPGALFALLATGYATQRLVLDVTRGIDERPLWGLTGTQLLAIVIAVAGIVILARLYRAPPFRADPPPAPDDEPVPTLDPTTAR